MDIPAIIRAVQAELGLPVDGKADPQTWGAIYTRLVPAPPAGQPAAALPLTATVDDRSETTIATLHGAVKPYARALVTKAADVGITIKIIGGTRTYAEQDALYAKGRTAPGPRVTNAKGGHSNHNFGIAFDVGVFQGKSYLGESPKYKAVGALGVELGLEWGGNWTSFKDQPHFQLRPAWAAGMSESAMLAELRARKAAGTDAYA